jgi:recombination protein RecT
MKLARQSGEVKWIEAHVVHKNDVFEEERGLNPVLIHRPARGDAGPPTHAYCVWKLADGEKKFEVMTAEQILAIKARSSSKNKQGDVVGPWVSDAEEMWRKTVVRRASKYMPRSTDSFAKAVALDNLREAGVDARVEDGEVLFDAEDITGGPGEPAVQVVQNLEEKVAAKKAEPAKDAAPQKEPLTKITPSLSAPEPMPAKAM